MLVEIGKMFNQIDISVSALKAQDRRMKLIANNIANARTTRTPAGTPYRRKDVVFSTDRDRLSGVRIAEVIHDSAPFKRVYDPGHPDARDGYVEYPNVEVPTEMVNLMSASRAYQASLALVRRYVETVEASLDLLR